MRSRTWAAIVSAVSRVRRAAHSSKASAGIPPGRLSGYRVAMSCSAWRSQRSASLSAGMVHDNSFVLRAAVKVSRRAQLLPLLRGVDEEIHGRSGWEEADQGVGAAREGLVPALWRAVQ